MKHACICSSLLVAWLHDPAKAAQRISAKAAQRISARAAQRTSAVGHVSSALLHLVCHWRTLNPLAGWRERKRSPCTAGTADEHDANAHDPGGVPHGRRPARTLCVGAPCTRGIWLLVFKAEGTSTCSSMALDRSEACQARRVVAAVAKPQGTTMKAGLPLPHRIQ